MRDDELDGVGEALGMLGHLINKLAKGDVVALVEVRTQAKGRHGVH